MGGPFFYYVRNEVVKTLIIYTVIISGAKTKKRTISKSNFQSVY